MEKKEDLKELFFNYSTKQWHFEELVNTSGLTRTNTNLWLKRLMKESLITRIKPRGKMPYYLSKYSDAKFKVQKKVFALQQFEKTGFLEHLSSLPAKTVIIFGSFSRADWHNESDIDLFIYGPADNFEKGHYEKVFHREIQVFHYEHEKDIKRLEPAVLPRIMAGIHVKGQGEPFQVSINA